LRKVCHGKKATKPVHHIGSDTSAQSRLDPVPGVSITFVTVRRSLGLVTIT
jgi:hypothetical protein